ncbi:MAG: PKD domain-containing protein [Bacteroidia bacterium]
MSNAAGMTYSWSASGGNILSGQSTAEISVRYASSGNYTIYIQVTDPDFGCSIQEPLDVLVNSKPVTGSIYHD